MLDYFEYGMLSAVFVCNVFELQKYAMIEHLSFEQDDVDVMMCVQGWDFSGYRWDSGVRSFQKAIRMVLRCIVSAISHLSGFRL